MRQSLLIQRTLFTLPLLMVAVIFTAITALLMTSQAASANSTVTRYCTVNSSGTGGPLYSEATFRFNRTVNARGSVVSAYLWSSYIDGPPAPSIWPTSLRTGYSDGSTLRDTTMSNGVYSISSSKIARSATMYVSIYDRYTNKTITKNCSVGF